MSAERRNQSVEQESNNLAERLAYSLLARQDFSRALTLCDGLKKDLSFKPLKEIGKVMARCGLDCTPVISHYARKSIHAFSGQEEIDQIESKDVTCGIGFMTRTGDFYVNGDLIEIYIAGGDFWKAEELLSEVSEAQMTDLQCKLALAKADHGFDHKPHLSWLLGKLDEYEAKYGNLNHQLAYKIARVQSQIQGEDPQIVLTRAEKGIRFSVWNLGELAQTYASCGYFDRALFLLEQMEEGKSEHKFEYLVINWDYVCREQIKRGRYLEALKSIETGLGAIDKMPDDHRKRHAEVYKAADFYILKGQAEAHLGQDSTSSFQMAQEKVQEEVNNEWKAETYMNLAKAKREIRQDPTPDLDHALWILENSVIREEFRGWDHAAQMIGFYDLVQLEAELGYPERAKNVLKRLEDWREKAENMNDWVAECLASIAETEMKKGATQKEIDSLTKADIEGILHGNNELAKQALIFFGLQR